MTRLRESSPDRLGRYSEVLSRVHPDFKGVRAFGASLGRLSPSNPDWNLDEITLRNPDYWRALMEMDSRDPSVYLAHANLAAIKGDRPLDGGQDGR